MPKEKKQYVSSSVLNEIILSNSLECFSGDKNDIILGQKPQFSCQERRRKDSLIWGRLLARKKSGKNITKCFVISGAI